VVREKKETIVKLLVDSGEGSLDDADYGFKMCTFTLALKSSERVMDETIQNYIYKVSN